MVATARHFGAEATAQWCRRSLCSALRMAGSAVLRTSSAPRWSAAFRARTCSIVASARWISARAESPSRRMASSSLAIEVNTCGLLLHVLDVAQQYGANLTPTRTEENRYMSHDIMTSQRRAGQESCDGCPTTRRLAQLPEAGRRHAQVAVCFAPIAVAAWDGVDAVARDEMPSPRRPGRRPHATAACRPACDPAPNQRGQLGQRGAEPRAARRHEDADAPGGRLSLLERLLRAGRRGRRQVAIPVRRRQRNE